MIKEIQLWGFSQSANQTLSDNLLAAHSATGSITDDFANNEFPAIPPQFLYPGQFDFDGAVEAYNVNSFPVVLVMDVTDLSNITALKSIPGIKTAEKYTEIWLAAIRGEVINGTGGNDPVDQSGSSPIPTGETGFGFGLGSKPNFWLVLAILGGYKTIDSNSNFGKAAFASLAGYSLIKFNQLKNGQ